MALNSSRSQNSAILAFTFAVNTLLSSMKNGGNSTNSSVFVVLNVGELHNPDYIFPQLIGCKWKSLHKTYPQPFPKPG